MLLNSKTQSHRLFRGETALLHDPKAHNIVRGWLLPAKAWPLKKQQIMHQHRRRWASSLKSCCLRFCELFFYLFFSLVPTTQHIFAQHDTTSWAGKAFRPQIYRLLDVASPDGKLFWLRFQKHSCLCADHTIMEGG